MDLHVGTLRHHVGVSVVFRDTSYVGKAHTCHFLQHALIKDCKLKSHPKP